MNPNSLKPGKLYRCIKPGYTLEDLYIETGAIVMLTNAEKLEFTTKYKCTFLTGKTSFCVTFDFGIRANKYTKFECWYEEYVD